MGAINGYGTDYWCIKGLLFNPKRRKKYFGIFSWQGLFFQYQNEVSDELAALIAEKVITPRGIIQAMIQGPLSDRLFLLIQLEVDVLLKEELGVTEPLVIFAAGTANYERVKTLTTEKILNSLPETMMNADEYIAETLDLKNLLAERLRELPPEEFEQVLRPAFQQDEWILIATGALLGIVAGFTQDLVIHMFAS